MSLKTYSAGYCPICQSKNIDEVVNIPSIPIYCNVLFKDPQAAKEIERGNIHLYYCIDCQHFFNKDFNPNLLDYNVSYENSLHFSPHFQKHAQDLSNYLIDKYDLHGKDIIDIGCGKGDFLNLICEVGANRGVGFDKSFERDELIHSQESSVTFIQDFYSEKYSTFPANILLCRHVLEHINAPQEFLQDIIKSIKQKINTVLYFEVPNALYTLEKDGIWDLIYEHFSYFTPFSLSKLFSLNNVKVNLVKVQYGGQFLSIESQVSATKLSDSKPVSKSLTLYDKVKNFEKNFKEKVSFFNNLIDNSFKEGKKSVIWGGGSKGITFANLINSKDKIEYIVDLNPRKNEKFVSGTGQQIIAPEFLKKYKPNQIIIMNKIYTKEIKNMVSDLGLNVQFINT